MKKLVFASNNQYKTDEIKLALADKYEILNLKDIGCGIDIPETGNTFAENASLKSKYVVEHYHIDCFADDSGLEVEALKNEPGVFSARYSGSRSDKNNIDLVLKNLEGKENRKARFKTVISLVKGGENYLFEGSVSGTIRNELSGENGFGYDPIFQPDGYSITFAEMTMEQKNKISHRAIALCKMIEFLRNN